MDGENGLICAYALNGDGGATAGRRRPDSGYRLAAQAALAVVVVLIFRWLRWL